MSKIKQSQSHDLFMEYWDFGVMVSTESESWDGGSGGGEYMWSYTLSSSPAGELNF